MPKNDGSLLDGNSPKVSPTRFSRVVAKLGRTGQGLGLGCFALAVAITIGCGGSGSDSDSSGGGGGGGGGGTAACSPVDFTAPLIRTETLLETTLGSATPTQDTSTFQVGDQISSSPPTDSAAQAFVAFGNTVTPGSTITCATLTLSPDSNSGNPADLGHLFVESGVFGDSNTPQLDLDTTPPDTAISLGLGPIKKTTNVDVTELVKAQFASGTTSFFFQMRFFTLKNNNGTFDVQNFVTTGEGAPKLVITTS